MEGVYSSFAIIYLYCPFSFICSSKNAGFSVLSNSEAFEDDDIARAAAALDDE